MTYVKKAWIVFVHVRATVVIAPFAARSMFQPRPKDLRSPQTLPGAQWAHFGRHHPGCADRNSFAAWLADREECGVESGHGCFRRRLARFGSHAYPPLSQVPNLVPASTHPSDFGPFAGRASKARNGA